MRPAWSRVSFRTYRTTQRNPISKNLLKGRTNLKNCQVPQTESAGKERRFLWLCRHTCSRHTGSRQTHIQETHMQQT